MFTLHLWKRCVGCNEDQTHDTKCVTVSSLVAIFVFIFHSSRYHLHCHHHHHPSGVLADGFSFHSHTIVTFHNMPACCGITFSRGNWVLRRFRHVTGGYSRAVRNKLCGLIILEWSDSRDCCGLSILQSVSWTAEISFRQTRLASTMIYIFWV